MQRYVFLMLTSFLMSLLWSYSFSYFESRYWCNVESWSLTISMNSGQHKCFDYLTVINNELIQVGSDLTQASNYITWWTDIDYWKWVQTSLLTQTKSLKAQQTQALIAIRDFERSLFNQIKSLLNYYLADQRTDLLQTIDRVRVELEDSKRVWNEARFQQYLRNMETLQSKLFLIDRIQFAHDFEEMVPFLKEFLYGTPQL